MKIDLRGLVGYLGYLTLLSSMDDAAASGTGTMALFGRQRQASRLPADIVPMMEMFGRFEFDPQGSGIDGARVWERLQAPLLPFAQADPDSFVTALAEAVLPVGGWATYGAAHTVMELLDPELDHPSYHAILEASLQFLRDSGVPNNRLNGYEWQFWFRNQGQAEPWLAGRPAPGSDDAPISDR